MGRIQDDGISWDRNGGSEANLAAAEGSQEVESARGGTEDTDALRASDFGHGGSNPSEPTTYVEWKTGMPEGVEQQVSVGQRRIVFIDGIGFFDAEIVSIHPTYLQVKDSDTIYDLDWDGLGILADGERMREAVGDFQEVVCQELESLSSKTLTK